MLHTSVSAGERRRAFRAGLGSGRLLRFPGAFTPLSATAACWASNGAASSDRRIRVPRPLARITAFSMAGWVMVSL